ncbi:MAG: pyridoxal phosphate-dependent aminotransferase [Bacteroidota bacterium]
MAINYKNDTPINYDIVSRIIEDSGLKDLSRATIREIVGLVNKISAASGVKFIRMEMGVPGLKPSNIGINAEIEALKNGVASDYPMLDGVQILKDETSKFVKMFMDVEVKPESCIPTVGSMQGGYASFMLVGAIDKKKDTCLFLDPGFPVQKQQMSIIGNKYESFDVYNYRGEKLKEKLESYLSSGSINSIIYSNPNNPSWICFTEEELQIIGELATKYDVIVIEDLAYFAMDFRKDLSKPGQAPFQATVAKYTNNYILMISSSKAFSYAGQRVGMVVFSDALYHRKYDGLKDRFNTEELGYTFVQRLLYALSSGTSHSAQYALAAMLKSANEGTYNFVEEVREYGERAHKAKKLFTDNGFEIVYDKDINEPIADGFYFTIAYPGISSGELLNDLMYYGIGAIALITCGSNSSSGLRACVSQIKNDQFSDLEFRLKKFKEHHS